MAAVNIQFKGIRHSPSDSTGVDGDVLECTNLVHENGELKPIEMPEETLVSNNGFNLIGIHNVTNIKNFVFAGIGANTVIEFKTESNSFVNIKQSQSFTSNMLIIAGEKLQTMQTVGNTVIAVTDKNTHYLFYKNGEYVYLG